MGIHRRAARGRVITAAVVMATALTAWSGAPASAKSSGPAVLTEEQISGALLTLEDLPADGGFLAFSGPPPEVPQPSQTGGVCDGPTQIAVAKKTGYSAAGLVYYFNSNTDGPYVSELAFSFPSASAATRFVKLARAQVTSCTSGWSETIIPGDPPANYEIKTVPFPKLGDQQFGSQTSRTGGGDDITRDPDLPGVIADAVVRVGNNVLLVSRMGISVVMDDARQALRANVEDAIARLATATKPSKTKP